ncbi:MAG: DUF2802 domain-containing protein [Bdellovibrionia bacterium]
MGFWFLVQILVNLVLFAGFAVLWMKLSRPAKDDPRLSKGLQLLQSKISVLEDLSDRTDNQVKQLTALLESKVIDVQQKIMASDKQLAKIEQSLAKSRELASIFQDRIPHEEIREREQTKKFVKAARMAHRGASVEQIIKETGLALAEAEFIAKVNKDQLQFCEDSLPDWALDDQSFSGVEQSDKAIDEISFLPPTQRGVPRDFAQVFEIPKADQSALQKLGEEFKAACDEVKATAEAKSQQEGFFDLNQLLNLEQKPTPKVSNPNPNGSVRVEKNLGVRPVEFRKIELVKDLQ